jgi:cytidine diphosphoramidate kinase
MNKGKLIWLTGLSCSGKTVIGKEIHLQWQVFKTNIVFLDGDTLREIFLNQQCYTLEARLKLALQYGKLCKMLTEQGLNVICATISLFKECHSWNRANIANYYEIYLKTSMANLLERDNRSLYKNALAGKTQNVIGVDLAYDEPEQPDLIIDNNGTNSVAMLAKQILDFCENK